MLCDDSATAIRLIDIGGCVVIISFTGISDDVVISIAQPSASRSQQHSIS